MLVCVKFINALCLISGGNTLVNFSFALICADKMTEATGYITGLSPEKTSNDGKKKYVEFQLQTAKKTYKRGICFDKPLTRQISQYADDHSPVKLRNASQSGSDIIVTKRTKIEDANNSEVNYEYSPATEHDREPSVVDIQNVSEAKSLPEGTFVRVRESTLFSDIRPDKAS